MKKYLIFPLTVLLFFAAQACSDDDSAITPEPEPPTVAEMLVGKWLLVSVTIDTGTQQAGECLAKTFIRFNTNGTAEQAEFILDSSGNCISSFMSLNYTLSLDDSTVLFYDDLGNVSSRRIISITTDKLSYESGGNVLNFEKETGPETE